MRSIHLTGKQTNTKHRQAREHATQAHLYVFAFVNYPRRRANKYLTVPGIPRDFLRGCYDGADKKLRRRRAFLHLVGLYPWRGRSNLEELINVTSAVCVIALLSRCETRGVVEYVARAVLLKAGRSCYLHLRSYFIWCSMLHVQDKCYLWGQTEFATGTPLSPTIN